MKLALERRFEGVAYLAVIAGIVGDQISTRLALTKPYNYETNLFTVANMQNGLWLPLDILSLVLSICVPALLMRKWRFEGRWAILVFPLILGTIRFAATVWNLHLFLF